MPRSLKRYYGSGDLHFITSSCYQRQPILGTPDRRDRFLALLEQARHNYRFVVLGYVVMPEHFHLLISEPEQGTPSTVLQAVKLGFARRLLVPLLGRGGGPNPPAHIWQRRFYDFVDPSTSLGTSAAGSHARKTPQLQRVDRAQAHRKVALHAS